MAEEPKDKDIVSEKKDTPAPQKKFGLLKNKWVKISVIGMAGLLIVVWATAVWVKP